MSSSVAGGVLNVAAPMLKVTGQPCNRIVLESSVCKRCNVILRGCVTHLRRDHDELVAANAGGQVAFPCDAANGVSRCSEDAISFAVAIGIVYLFEIV